MIKIIKEPSPQSTLCSKTPVLKGSCPCLKDVGRVQKAAGVFKSGSTDFSCASMLIYEVHYDYYHDDYYHDNYMMLIITMFSITMSIIIDYRDVDY
jgi:hypothetical protein